MTSDQNVSTRGLGTAVVIGASVAGSSAAAALSTRFGEVIVIDRDTLPAEATKRRGVPHSGQFHILSAGGRLDLEAIFPGLTDDLTAVGVPYADPTAVFRYGSKFGWFPRHSSDMRILLGTRRYLEWYLRGRAAKLGNVTYIQRTPAKGLVIEDGRAVGVEVEDLDTKELRVIRADLIVDASGRPSIAPDWFAEAGYAKPVETVINARWGYATTYVRVPEGFDPGWTALYVGPTVSGEGYAATRGASMWRQEDNLMVVTAQGCAGDLPPSDVEGFLDFISSFGSSEFRDLIEQYGRVSGIEAWQNTSNRLRDWSNLKERPENFVVVGDAAAAFNPIYGQGMTVAARGARTLDSSLTDFLQDSAPESGLDGFAERFQNDLQAVIEPSWMFSTTSDYGIPGVEINGVTQESSKSPESEYADRVIALATEDESISLKFMETINMVRSTEWLGDEALRDRVLGDWDRLGSLRRSDVSSNV
ncbi:FAD-dependent monooxygenase [Arthrobacter sp. NtRootA1]|uniref:NAD(P)/FAD-dependent oxidoreductase n=1 Tax=Micrococcaceae TaxID=1268 RepID=UPI001CC582B2|nr:FAD-dependent monooxygenase [Arthrobacter sp. NtRootA1]BCW05887.1 hypothetical protein NtRootA1_20250 [Arthrobacter sp. NtRootA1]